jgi:hypothetical protein
MWMGHRLVLNEIKSTSNAKTIPLIIFLTNFEECKFAPQTLKPLKTYLIVNFRISYHSSDHIS